ncbi:unnamed protein product [Effrenium voratum]|uniref:J domain-containing protein n=1 Tax=Effrenium voratum TaxID=2562239 RepID=A0AA36MT71_9DINO|nr:unnamed protein product [Effrenium voratum]
MADFSSLTYGEDYKSQFSPQLSVKNLLEVLLQEGFEFMEEGTCTNVKLLDGDTQADSKISFMDVPKNSADPRLSDVKRGELERIRKCKTSAEVLELQPGATASAAQKAFFRKSVLVHPDKNGFPGATEAMKILSSAREAAEKGRSDQRLEVAFDVGEAPAELPQLLSFRRQTKVEQADFWKLDGQLGFRSAITAETEVDDPKARSFLESAWRNGEMMEKGKLKADKVFSIEAVRYKQWKAYSNGVLRVMLNEVKQKSFNTRGQFGTFPEITLTSSALDEAMARENAAMGSLFKDLVESALSLCGRLNASA